MLIDLMQQRLRLLHRPTVDMRSEDAVDVKTGFAGKRMLDDEGMASILRRRIRIADPVRAGRFRPVRASTEDMP